MAKQSSPTNEKRNVSESPTLGSEAAANPELRVLAQYIKDLSFESPSAPDALRSPGQNPQLHLDVNVRVTPGPEETHEVALNLAAHTKNEAGVIYHLELTYAGIFRPTNVPRNLLPPILWVNCPMMLFPFLRRMVGDITQEGGFPPLKLDPIDFGSLYARQLAEAKATLPAAEDRSKPT